MPLLKIVIPSPKRCLLRFVLGFMVNASIHFMITPFHSHVPVLEYGRSMGHSSPLPRTLPATPAISTPCGSGAAFHEFCVLPCYRYGVWFPPVCQCHHGHCHVNQWSTSEAVAFPFQRCLKATHQSIVSLSRFSHHGGVLLLVHVYVVKCVWIDSSPTKHELNARQLFHHNRGDACPGPAKSTCRGLRTPRVVSSRVGRPLLTGLIWDFFCPSKVQSSKKLAER